MIKIAYLKKKNDYLLDPSVLIVLQSRMISTEDSLFALSVFRKKVRQDLVFSVKLHLGLIP